MEETRYRIEEVASMTGLSKRAVRYYEEVALFTPEGRSVGGYRLYSGRDLARLRHIVALRDALGYTLEEIKEVLSAEDELAQIRTAFAAGGELPERIASAQRALAILQREEQRAAQKLQQIAAVRERYQERAQRLLQRIAELRAAEWS